MSRLAESLNDYLAMRRALGFELRAVAGCLRNFVTFLESNSASFITTELALQWATRPGAADSSTSAWRLGMVRRFAVWFSAAEPRIYLDALDKELERRGHTFCRFADDCNIYVGSRAAAERTLTSIQGWIETHLRLKVNAAKSGTGRVWERKFLGFRLDREGGSE